MSKSEYESCLVNFKRKGTLADIDKAINKSETRYFSRTDFIEVAVKRLLAEEKAAKQTKSINHQ
jgi:metal-responsive CopG/Arc/MetJ family transcriptional regulator